MCMHISGCTYSWKRKTGNEQKWEITIYNFVFLIELKTEYFSLEMKRKCLVYEYFFFFLYLFFPLHAKTTQLITPLFPPLSNDIRSVYFHGYINNEHYKHYLPGTREVFIVRHEYFLLLLLFLILFYFVFREMNLPLFALPALL